MRDCKTISLSYEWAMEKTIYTYAENGVSCLFKQ